MLNSVRNSSWASPILLQTALVALILPLLLALPMAGCSGSRGSSERTESREMEREREREREEEEEEDERPKLPDPPPAWGAARITVEPAEGRSDTIRFHIGSPFFLRLKIADSRTCEPFQGQPFFFDAPGAQLGWGFREVTDSILFPRTAGSCERIVMLSSEGSNRVAEGEYSFKLLFFVDAAERIYSDTLVVQAVRSASGADTLSYARFLQEQIVNNSPLLSDPETVHALFAEGTPRSAESEIYRAIILFRGGDITGADEAIRISHELETRRKRPLSGTAAAARAAIARSMAGNSSR